MMFVLTHMMQHSEKLSSVRNDFTRLCDEHVRPILTSGIASQLQPLSFIKSITPARAFAALQVIGFVRAFLIMYAGAVVGEGTVDVS